MSQSIAPASSPASGSSLQTQSSDLANASQSALQARARPSKHAAYACLTCKTSKRRCVGGQPCEACTKRRLNCIFDESTDGRRKTSRKRKAANLERESTLLTNIIANFRDGSREDIDRMVALIRAVPSVEEAKDALERQALSERQEQISCQQQSEAESARPSCSSGLPQHAEPSGQLERADRLRHGAPIDMIPRSRLASNLEQPP